MTGEGNRALFAPARPIAPKAYPSFWRFLHAARTNALLMWPDDAYERPFIRQSFLGHTRLLLNDPAAIHHVLVGHPGNYRRPTSISRIIRPIAGDGLVLSEGEAWRHQRRTIAPALGPRIIPLLCHHVAASLAETIEQLRRDAAAPVNMRSVLQNLALNIAGRSMFSLEMHDYGDAITTAMTRYNERHTRPSLLDMVLPLHIPSPRDFGRRRFQRGWMGLVETIMEARLRLPPTDTPRDLFDLLIAARDPESGQGFSRDQLRDQTATMILAGHETTATTLFWSLTLLAQVPAEQERVAMEAASHDFSPDAAAATLAELPQTRAVISEALRLYPPAFTLAREAIAADNAAGIEIPAGALIWIAPWVLHRHRRLWRDPDAFDPSRFLPAAPTPPRFAYLPFGAGPRVCIGSQFALAEATLVLAALIRNFRVELVERQPVLPVAVATTQPDRAPLFRLIPRPAA